MSKKFDHIREKAVVLRKSGKSLGDICNMLNRSKTTVYYWIKDVEIENINAFLNTKKQKVALAQKKASLAIRKKFRLLHEESRKEAEKLWNESLKNDFSFQQFIMLYWCEGYKKTKNSVSLANSDISLLKLGKKWIEKLTKRPLSKIEYLIQLHEDQDEKKLFDFWTQELNIDKIKISRKTNSGKMKGRNWNSEYGVLTIRIGDSYLKTKIDFWIEKLRENLTSPTNLKMKG